MLEDELTGHVLMGNHLQTNLAAVDPCLDFGGNDLAGDHDVNVPPRHELESFSSR